MLYAQSDQKEGQRETKAEGSSDQLLWCQHNRTGLRKLWRCYGGVEVLLWNGGVGFLRWGAGVLGSIMVGWSCYGGVEGWWRDGSVMAGWRYYDGVMGRC